MESPDGMSHILAFVTGSTSVSCVIETLAATLGGFRCCPLVVQSPWINSATIRRALGLLIFRSGIGGHNCRSTIPQWPRIVKATYRGDYRDAVHSIHFGA